MNGLSHKQAMALIHLRMDGMLKGNEALVLDEHLRSCEACREYSHEMESLPAYLNNEFKERWEDQPMPNMVKRVSTQARNIPMTQRFSSGMKVLTGAATLVLLAFTMNFVISRLQSTSLATTENGNDTTPAFDGKPATGLLAFTSDRDGNSEIYTMHADGSGLTNLTHDPAYDGYPFWSPDGRQIAFASDRDGSSMHIYMMNADGSNLTQLTNGEGNYALDVNGFSPWSPDGTKLVILHKAEGDVGTRIYVLDVLEKSLTPLTNDVGQYLSISWSPDGTHVAFVEDTGRIPQDVYLVGSDGSGLVKLTANLPAGEYFMFEYDWSQDGSSLFFVTHNNQQSYQDATYIATIYKASMDGSMEIAARSTDRQILEWSSDMQVRLESGESRLRWVLSDGSESELKLCENNGEMMGIVHKQSHAGDWFLGSNCSPNGWMLYWTDPAGTTILPLSNAAIPSTNDIIFNLQWSLDDRYVAFVGFDSRSADSTESLYVLDVVKAREDPSTQPIRIPNSLGPSWQPISAKETVEDKPTPHPAPSDDIFAITTNISNGEWIAFIGGTQGSDLFYNPASFILNQNVFLIHPDGSGLVNLTDFPAHYSGLEWSPNGQYLTFLRENTSLNKIDIMIHYTGSTGAGVIARPITDPDMYGYNWSPNSDKIVFADASNGNYDIYTIHADGRNDPKLTQLTDDPAQDVGFAWSPDGSQIAFQRLNADQLSVYVMNEDGTDPHEVARGMGRVSLRWSMDGQSLYASPFYRWDGTKYSHLECEGCAAKPALYRIDLHDASTQQIYYEQDPNKIFYLYEAPQNILYFMSVEKRDASVGLWGTWMYWDGNSVHEIGDMDPHQTCKTTTGNILSEDISPNERFSIITNYCAGGFDVYIADRETSDPEKKFIHLLRLPLDTWGEGGDGATLPIQWSPDGRWLIYADDGHNTHLRILDINKAVYDPDHAISTLLQQEYVTDASGQEYMLPTLTVFDLVWQPAP